jgi:hypothetical protein
MTLKSFFIIFLKNLVNALLTNSTLLALWHSQVNFTHAGLLNMLRVAGGCVAAREALVWGPILLRWSSTNADPSALDIASAEAGKAVSHAIKAQDAISDAKAEDTASKS